MLLDIRIPVAEPLDIFQAEVEKTQFSSFDPIIPGISLSAAENGAAGGGVL